MKNDKEKKLNEEAVEIGEKQSKTKTGFKIGGFLVAVFLLLYIPSLFNWFFSRSINTEIIRIGTIEQAYNTEAFLIRSEEILKSPFDGKYIPEVAEGERVPANQRVATILKGASEKLLNDMKELDLRIIKAQKEKFDTQEIFSADVSKLDKEIQQKVKLLASESDANNLEKTSRIKEDIDGLIQKKASIIGSTSTSDVFLNSLRTEKEGLQAKINAGTKDIFSQAAGIISYTVDGYEQQLSIDAIRSLTPKFLEGIKGPDKSKSPEQNVAYANMPFAKVIKDIDCYVVVVLEAEKTALFRIDDSVGVRFNDLGKTVDGTVDYKSEVQEGKCVVAVKIDKGVSETASLRKTNIDLIRNSYHGLKVPVESLRKINKDQMTAEITLDKANYASIRPVKITGANDEWAVIESLKKTSEEGVSLYDIYVVNPTNIQEGQVINK